MQIFFSSCQTKIYQTGGPRLIQQNVRWLYIPVYHAATVRGMQCMSNAGDNRHSLVNHRWSRERPVAELVGKGLTRDILRNQKEVTVRCPPYIVDRDDAGMI